MITPYWYQEAAYQAFIEYVESGRGKNPLIALPTGTGKSIVVGLICQRLLQQWSGLRFLMLTHVKELISQNYERLLEIWPSAPVGIYSAGLNKRDTALPIVFGGVASVVKQILAFGPRDVIIIDEAHLVSVEGMTMYAMIIAKLREQNPHLIVCGLTATPYRTGRGLLVESGLFTHTIFDLTDVAGFNRLMAEGFICPLFAKQAVTEYDLRQVHRDAHGEFRKGELERAVNKRDITEKILEELVYFGQDRGSWLIFASGVAHADEVAAVLRDRFGVIAASVHSKMSRAERDGRLKGFKDGRMRCLVSNNICTTGFDHRPIDLIGMMRPTESTGLHVQMAGRGTRPSPETGKRDCLYLDFAGNTRRLGPINDPLIPQAPGAGGGSNGAPVRVCGACGVYNHASARTCIFCGAEFDFAQKLFETAGTEEIIKSDTAVVETFPVARVLYAYHDNKKPGKIQTMRVTYICKGGLQSFTEYIGLDHSGAFGKRARDWWRQRHGTEPPTPDTCAPYDNATKAALTCTHEFRVPARIRVHVNIQYPEIVGVEYD